MTARIADGKPTVVRPDFGKNAFKSTQKKSSRNGLFSLIESRVTAIDRLDPERGRKAFRVFLESVILHEFGNELMNDPAFYRLVDDIQLRMEAEPKIAAMIATAVSVLLSKTSEGTPPPANWHRK
ncbi:MAG TPA: hypothetical protein VEC06_08845 [Paucimonas sp.]|nr:hypothetical protein [Paucimonas sp.]